MPLGKRSDLGDSRYSGVEIDFSQDVGQAMEEYLLCGFDFVTAPLVHASHQAPPLRRQDGEYAPAKLRTELMLQSAQHGGQIVGRTSSWLDPDSADAALADRSSDALSQELSWAAFLGLQAVIVQPQPGSKLVNTAQLVNKSVAGLSHMAIWLRLPLTAPSTAAAAAAAATVDAADPKSGSSSAQEPERDSWEDWFRFFTMCEHSNFLGVALDVPLDLPRAPQLLQRWLGQPLKALLLPTAAFTTNKRGYPVLGKPHQDLVCCALRHGVQVILTGGPLHKVAPSAGSIPPPPQPPSTSSEPAAAPSTPSPAPTGRASASASASSSSASALSIPQAAAAAAAAGGGQGGDPVLPFPIINPGESHPMRPYWEYLCYLFRRIPDSEVQEVMEAGYRDYLQAPLQPLQDDLESQTYETFEKDVTKYLQYQEAVRRALLDRAVAAAEAEQGEGGTDSSSSSKPTIIMVVGAGRGPLVRASLAAADAAGCPVHVYAVEKNPCALVHIQALVAREGWGERVTIVAADMRTWQAPAQADILVSELLGSFGDNELSPECLDGAQRFLAPGGISIPSSYTSYLAPLTTWKLYDGVRAYKDLEHCETPYVVKPHRACVLAPPQAVFTFHHPNHDQPINNNRFATLTFPRLADAGSAEVHGLVGYFESVLYKDVTLNTHPPTHTPNMFSWFPIFFPLRDPVYVPAGQPIEVQMWRKGASHKVWYEWALTAPQVTPIHNPGGRSYWVGL